MAYLEELLPEFRKGAKIRLDSWDKEKYIFYTGSDVHDNNDKTVKIEGYQLYIYEWEFYQEPIDWDYIIKNKCLCWFWDEWFGAACIGVLGEIHKECDLKFVLRDENGNNSQFRNCRPVRKDEVTFYEDKKDDQKS